MPSIPNAGLDAEPVARRDLAIDAMRGAAMLFVLLSHFGFVLVEPWSGVPVAVGDGLTVIGMVASPAFMLVSGVTMAMLAEDAARFERLRWKLVDRGLFTLVVGHVLLGLADGTLLSSSPLRQNLVITDVVGLATIVAALTRVPGTPGSLFRVAAGLCAVQWIVFAFAEPSDTGARWVIGILAGSRTEEVARRGFPLLPWMAVYCTGLGLGKLRRSWAVADVPLEFARLGAFAMALGLACWSVRRGATWSTGWPEMGTMPYRLLSPLGKYPPGLVYLLCFGGAALGLFAAISRLAATRGAGLPARLAPMGRASLFTFVAQALLLQQVLPTLHPDMHRSWPLWLAGITCALYAMAWAWQRHGLNELFTLGLSTRNSGSPRTPSRQPTPAPLTSNRSR